MNKIIKNINLRYTPLISTTLHINHYIINIMHIIFFIARKCFCICCNPMDSDVHHEFEWHGVYRTQNLRKSWRKILNLEFFKWTLITKVTESSLVAQTLVFDSVHQADVVDRYFDTKFKTGVQRSFERTKRVALKKWWSNKRSYFNQL